MRLMSAETATKVRAMAEQRCKLCGSRARFRFEVPLCRGLQGWYFECEACGLLQTCHLDRLTESELRDLYRPERSSDPDPAAAWRQYCVAARLIELSRLGLLPRGPEFKALDFGCGAGFVVGFLTWKLGWSMVGFDPYSSFSFAADRCFSDWDPIRRRGPFHLVVASEVWEHFRRPSEEFDRIGAVLDPDSACLFVTTEAYRSGRHDAAWPYLAPQSGQHVAFYSAATLRYLANRLGMQRVETVGTGIEWLLARESRGRWRRLRRSSALAALRCGVAAGLLPKIC